jgi:hypothetical protein
MKGPTIVLVFEETNTPGIDATNMKAALQEYIDKYLAPAWGVTAQLRLGTKVLPGEWSLIFADDSDQAQALGYHDLDGAAPRGFVFVHTSQQAGEAVSVTASHELAELLLDPGCNLGAYSPRSRWIAREICDPVQGSSLSINGLPMANFVLPSWYGAGPAPYDAAGACDQPWQILPGGYVPVWSSSGWTPIFGSHAAVHSAHKRGAGDSLRRLQRRNKNTPHREPEGLLC